MGQPAVGWFEVTGMDGPKLQRFCGDLFDWQVQDVGQGYGVVAAADKGIGGRIGVAQDGGRGYVSFYVEVDDPAAYLSKANAHSAQTVTPVTDLARFGITFALFTDPEGHLIGLSKGAAGWRKS